MRRIITILLLLAVALLPATAQRKKASALRKDIIQAKTYLKAGNNLDKAEKLMQKHLEDSANRTNERLWLIMFDAVRKQYEQGNMKLYLKQKYDTAAFFNLTMRMFRILETFDSIDATPNSKGEVKPQYRRRNAEFLDRHRANLFNGGTYFIGKQKFTEAYSFFNSYLDCAVQPLFSHFDYSETDPRMPEAAYWAAYCGYKNQDTRATLHHTYLALKDTAHYCMMLQYLADTYRQDNDTLRYVETLKEGFLKYPLFPFFFQRLVSHYVAEADWPEVLSVAERAIKTDTSDIQFQVIRSTALLNMRQYDPCITASNHIIAADSGIATAWYNAGMACFNQAVDIDKNVKLTKQQRQQVRDKYQQALAYMSRYRELAPDQRDSWGLPLYTIYLNLNMGNEFDEINQLLRRKR